MCQKAALIVESRRFDDMIETYLSTITANSVLTLAWQDPASPLYGVNRNPDKLAINCDNCIGACCVGVNLPVNPSEFRCMMQDQGTVPLQIYDSVVLSTLERAPKSKAKGVKVDFGGLNKGIMKDIAARDLEGKKRVGLYMVGACALLTKRGKCSVHCTDKQPDACKGFIAGSQDCRNRFVAKESRAAKIVENFLNRGLPLLTGISGKLIMRTHTFPKEYSF